MDHYYRRSCRVASRVVGGEAVLVKLPESVLHCLSPSASRIWAAADGDRTGRDLAGGLGDAGAQAFLDEMVEKGLLERAEAPFAAAAFPQEVDWPEEPSPPEAPTIRSSEVIEALAGECNFSVICSLPDV
jgi:hypothetical protein